MTKREENAKKGAGYHPDARPERVAKQAEQPGVCEECSYHNSHSPTCSQNPENKK